MVPTEGLYFMPCKDYNGNEFLDFGIDIAYLPKILKECYPETLRMMDPGEGALFCLGDIEDRCKIIMDRKIIEYIAYHESKILNRKGYCVARTEKIEDNDENCIIIRFHMVPCKIVKYPSLPKPVVEYIFN